MVARYTYIRISERSTYMHSGRIEARRFQLRPTRVLPKSACLIVAGRLRHAQVKVVNLVPLGGYFVMIISINIWVWTCKAMAFGLLEIRRHVWMDRRWIVRVLHLRSANIASNGDM